MARIGCIALLLPLAACVRSKDLMLPPAGGETGAAIVAVDDQYFALRSLRTTLTVREPATLTVFSLAPTLEEMQLEEGPLELIAPPAGRVLQPVRVVSARLDGDGPVEWAPVDDPPELRIAELDRLDCIDDDHCVRDELCVSPCPQDQIDAPLPPELPQMLPCPADWVARALEDEEELLVCEPNFPSDCPAGEFADFAWPAGTKFVNASATAPGDGTRENPFSDLGTAIDALPAGGTIALASGTYFAGARMLTSAFELRGRCAAMTAIGTIDPEVAPLSVAAPVTLEGLTIRGGHIGLAVSGLGHVKFSRGRVSDTEGVGVLIAGDDSSAELSELVIERARTSDPHSGFGVYAHTNAKLTLERSLIEGCDHAGLVIAIGATATITDVVVRDISPGPRSRDGYGIVVSQQARAHLRRVLVERASQIAVQSLAGAHVEADHLITHCTRDLANGAVAFNGAGEGSAVLRRWYSRGDDGMAIGLQKARVDVQDFTVRRGCRGVAASDAPQVAITFGSTVTLSRVALHDAPEHAMVIEDIFTRAEVRDLSIERPGVVGLRFRAIDEDLSLLVADLERVRITNALGAAYELAGFVDVECRECAATNELDTRGGEAISILGGSISRWTGFSISGYATGVTLYRQARAEFRGGNVVRNNVAARADTLESMASFFETAFFSGNTSLFEPLAP